MVAGLCLFWGAAGFQGCIHKVFLWNGEWSAEGEGWSLLLGLPRQAGEWGKALSWWSLMAAGLWVVRGVYWKMEHRGHGANLKAAEDCLDGLRSFLYLFFLLKICFLPEIFFYHPDFSSVLIFSSTLLIF